MNERMLGMLHRRALEHMSTEELLAMLAERAVSEADGHYTIMAFTTNYRVGFGTPMHRDDVQTVPARSTLRAAIVDALVNNTKFGQ